MVSMSMHGGALGIGANDPMSLPRTIVTGKNAMAIGSRAQAQEENAMALGFKMHSNVGRMQRLSASIPMPQNPMA